MTDKRTAKRSRIMDAATRRFSAHGYQQTRMADIAADLEMKAGSLYYYFTSKESLLATIVETNVGLATAALEEIVVGEGRAIGKIRRAVESHLSVFAEQPDLYAIFLSEKLDAISPDLAATADNMGRRYERLWIDLIEAGAAAGDLRSDLDAWVTMKAVVGLCNSMLFWFSPGGSMKPSDLSDAFARLVLDGIALDGVVFDTLVDRTG
jgi:AcrR family transcriptional regulator